jgi:glycosyltransferase involved in cell wall biosynthesis
MKRILFLLDSCPYPVKDGGKIRTSNFINSLSKDHELSLLYIKDGISNDPQSELDNTFKKVWIVPKDNRKEKCYGLAKVFQRIRLLGEFFKFKPWEVQEFNERLAETLEEIINQNNFDVIFCRYMYSARYFIELNKEFQGKIIVDLDDIEPIKINRSIKSHMKKGSYLYMRSMVNNFLFSRYHKKLKSVDDCLVCSESDSKYVKNKKWCKEATVIPNAIDVQKYGAIAPFSKEILNEKIFLCCGHLGYAPNVDGLMWFIDEVWPKVITKHPKAKLFIVGRTPKSCLKDKVDNKSIFLFADVESVLPYYEKACASVVPLHVGGGTRIKILESFSCYRPVISTTIGAEGLGVKHQKNCLIADDATDFANGCLKLLNDFQCAKALTEEGYIFVKGKYDYPEISKMIKCLFR